MIASQKYILVVPLCVISVLDEQKAGVSAINKSARAVTQLIETVCVKHESFKAQQLHCSC